MNNNISRYRKSLACLLTAIVACSFMGSNAVAQDGDGWDFRITPYIWFMSIEGETAVAGQNVDVEASFSDILDSLNVALSVNFEANNGTFFFVLDGLYSDLELDIEPNSFISASAETQIVVFDALVGVNISEYFDLYTGARYNSQDITVIPTMLPSFELGDDWLDYLIGVRAKGPVSDNWAFSGRLDTAFAGDSRSMWYLEVMFHRYFGRNKNMHLDLGFRFLTVDYESGSGLTRFLWDVDQYAPVVGYSWTF